MRHRRLFAIRVRHEFHGGGGCPDLRITPRGRALARHRLMVRARPDGVEVVAPVDDADQPFIAFADDLALRFDVRVTGPDFARYTDLAAWSAPGRPVYRGSDATGGALALELEPPPRIADVAAEIEVTDIASAWLQAPPVFSLDLTARQAVWVYYLTTTRAGDAVPEIRDGDVGRALTFAATALTPELSPTDDPVGHALVTRLSGQRCVRMVSDRPLACNTAPVRPLELRLGDELLIRELPNPSFVSQATLRVDPNQPLSESLFRVVEY